MRFSILNIFLSLGTTSFHKKSLRFFSFFTLLTGQISHHWHLRRRNFWNRQVAGNNLWLLTRRFLLIDSNGILFYFCPCMYIFSSRLTYFRYSLVLTISNDWTKEPLYWFRLLFKVFHDVAIKVFFKKINRHIFITFALCSSSCLLFI